MDREKRNVKVLTLKTAVMQPQVKECRKLFTVRSGERQGMDSPPEPPEGVQLCQTPLFPYSDPYFVLLASKIVRNQFLLLYALRFG